MLPTRSKLSVPAERTTPHLWCGCGPGLWTCMSAFDHILAKRPSGRQEQGARTASGPSGVPASLVVHEVELVALPDLGGVKRRVP